MKRPTLAALTVLTAAAALPASASAASIALTVPGGAPTIAYTAGSREVNALEMHGTVAGSLDLRMPFNEYSAPLTVGASCTGTLPTLCGFPDQAFPVTVSLGDKNDVASVNSFTGRLTMDAGPGNDDVLAGGTEATADGGGGDDSVILAANGGTTGSGGSGRDRLYGGLGAAATQLTGGSGNDLLVTDAFFFDDAKGGTGNDRIVGLSGDRASLSGEDGSDIVVATGGRSGAVLDGGAGADLIYTHVGGANVSGGAGYDGIDVRGGEGSSPDTVTCGSGFDAVWADTGDSVASDCELVIRNHTAPELPGVSSAIAAAQELAAHRPDPGSVKK
jgi:Ca2+-binding RTX toxin-like protein